MKKNHITILIMLIIGVWACNNEPKEDVNPPAKLKVLSITDSAGNNFDVKIRYEKDTVWEYRRIKADTLFDATGKPIKDAENKLVITYDTTYTPGERSGKFILLDTVLLPALEGLHKNKLFIELESNARWQAPLSSPKKSWFIPINGIGGGSGKASFKVDNAVSQRRSKSKKEERQVVMQHIYTRDSAMLYQIPFDQIGYRE